MEVCGANNPTMVAYIEAFGTLGIPNDGIKVLNLGTCDSIELRGASLNRGGLWQWRMAGVDVVLRGQSASVAKHVRFLIGTENLLRIDSPVPAGFLALDAFQRSSDLVAKAAHHSRIHMPEIESKFLHHKAPDFIPVYQ